MSTMELTNKKRAPRNRTLVVRDDEVAGLRSRIVFDEEPATLNHVENTVVCGDAFQVLKRLPGGSFDLLFADPPYNLTKHFGNQRFTRSTDAEYEEWLDSWLELCAPLLKKTASIYVCGDWRSGAVIQRAASRYFRLQNRITWEREKGRGARRNWKNTAEDIWFFTVSDEYKFDLDAVKLKRKVIAPYTDSGKPKDWDKGATGNYRLTHPSNIWTDISVPFWSMPENTDHPTQKPEKLLAKIILASTEKGDRVLDPFVGSGTTAVVANKLGRRFVAIESVEAYCLLAAKRLRLAESDCSIQGFSNGVFWERNSNQRQ